MARYKKQGTRYERISSDYLQSGNNWSLTLGACSLFGSCLLRVVTCEPEVS